MSLHLSLRLRAHIRVLYRCTSLALQPAAGVQHSCSQTGTFSHHLALPPPNPMQGKIKGRSTNVRVKLVCTWGGRGTRRNRSRAVTGPSQRGDTARHRVARMAIHASLGVSP
jgi:hypothetical protein